MPKLTITYKGSPLEVDTENLSDHVRERALSRGLEILADGGEFEPSKPKPEEVTLWVKDYIANHIQEDAWKERAEALYAAACAGEVTGTDWLVLPTKNSKYWKVYPA
jgi:hypothetical protein